MQIVHIKGSAGAIRGLVHFLSLSTVSSFCQLGVAAPLLAFCRRQWAGLCKWLVCWRAAVKLRLWGRWLNFFHSQLPLGLLGSMGSFNTLSVSFCQIVSYVFEGPLNENIVKLHFGSHYRNPKLYGVSEPELMIFFSRNAVSIHPHTIKTLGEKTPQSISASVESINNGK